MLLDVLIRGENREAERMVSYSQCTVYAEGMAGKIRRGESRGHMTNGEREVLMERGTERGAVEGTK